MGVIVANGVRVGIEDKVRYDDNRTRKATNYELVERVNNLASIIDRPLASTDDIRRIIELNTKV